MNEKPAAPAPHHYCECPPTECHGEGIRSCRWYIMRENGWIDPKHQPHDVAEFYKDDAAPAPDAEGYATQLGWLAGRAERAELQLTAAHQLQREHTVQLLRAEAERDDLALELHEERANSGRVHEALSRAEAERDEAREANREWLLQNGPGGWINDLRVERDALKALLVEAQTTVSASIIEEGISDQRREYRKELLARIDAALQQEKK